MAAKKGSIVFQGDVGSPHTGQRGKTTIDGATDLEAVETLATTLDDYTTANKGSSTLHSSNHEIGARPGTGANMDRKGIVIMMEEGTGKMVRLTLPAFSADAEDVEKVEGGERITVATRDAIASACSTATGKTLKAIDGYIIQPK